MTSPLAHRLRPQTLDDIVGQRHLIGPDGPIRKALTAGKLGSMIFWGPPGCGKTTLADVIGKTVQAQFHHLSAVLAGIQDLRKLVDAIQHEQAGLFAGPHVLFVDEIHRWNKAQQDALLPYVEQGTITLIGATTENPSFEIIAPLLSRATVYVLQSLGAAELTQIARHALQVLERTADDDALAWIVRFADGDARMLLNLLEVAHTVSPQGPFTQSSFEQSAQQKSLRYDKKGEEHYNIISAFIKSMRASDANAAVYYLARMYEAGEDPRFIARRMVIFASEDISNADPAALSVAVAAFQAYEIVGQAEGWIPLAQAATYLATAPKSNASYAAYKAAKADVAEHGVLPVPLHLRNAPTKLMKELGYGQEYRYPHSDPEGAKTQAYLPDALRGRIYYKLPK